MGSLKEEKKKEGENSILSFKRLDVWGGGEHSTQPQTSFFSWSSFLIEPLKNVNYSAALHPVVAPPFSLKIYG